MLFSVYGHIKKCDLIRDWKTGQSLQYAFIEYETKAACEEAYFKMDNALVDERRIHVDFSQSVSRLWNKFRRRQTHGHHEPMNHEDIVLKKKYTPSAHKIIEADYEAKRRGRDHQPVAKKEHQNNRRDDDREDRKEREKRGKRDHKKRSRRSSSSSSSPSRSSSSLSSTKKKKNRSRSRGKK